MSPDNKAIYRRFLDEVVVGKNVEVLDELFHLDAVLSQGSLDGLRAQMSTQAEGVDVAVRDLHQFVDGDWLVTHMALDITHSGTFMGYPATGKTAHIEEVECARIVDGKIAEMFSVADVTSAFIQLGIPLPASV
jgi:predicted ester cyclase